MFHAACALHNTHHQAHSISHPLLRYFNLKNGVSKDFLGFYEDFNKTTEDKRQKIVDILLKEKLDFAHLSAYSAESANVKPGKLFSVYKFL